MKILARVILFLMFLIPLKAEAVTFNVLVLPADLMKVCGNYYCFDEVSNIMADDVINYFNGSPGIVSPTLYTVRAKLNANPPLKSQAVNVLKKYNYNERNLDFATLKVLSDAFSAKSVLLISSTVKTDKSNVKRSLWEVLELSSSFGIVYPYTLSTDAVLVDTVNGLVMWSGHYTRKAGNNNNEFWAKSSSQAESKLEQIKYYSKNISAKSIAQNVTLRFFPKTANTLPVTNSSEPVPIRPFFKINTPADVPETSSHTKTVPEVSDGEEGTYGEMIYGL